MSLGVVCLSICLSIGVRVLLYSSGYPGTGGSPTPASASLCCSDLICFALSEAKSAGQAMLFRPEFYWDVLALCGNIIFKMYFFLCTHSCIVRM